MSMLFTAEQSQMNYNEVSSLFGNLMAFAGNIPAPIQTSTHSAQEENTRDASLIETFLIGS